MVHVVQVRGKDGENATNARSSRAHCPPRLNLNRGESDRLLFKVKSSRNAPANNLRLFAGALRDDLTWWWSPARLPIPIPLHRPSPFVSSLFFSSPLLLSFSFFLLFVHGYMHGSWYYISTVYFWFVIHTSDSTCSARAPCFSFLSPSFLVFLRKREEIDECIRRWESRYRNVGI